MSALRIAAPALASALLFASCASRPWNGDETGRIGEAMAAEPLGEELADGVPMGAMPPLSRARGRAPALAGELQRPGRKLKVRGTPRAESSRAKAPRAR